MASRSRCKTTPSRKASRFRGIRSRVMLDGALICRPTVQEPSLTPTARSAGRVSMSLVGPHSLRATPSITISLTVCELWHPTAAQFTAMRLTINSNRTVVMGSPLRSITAVWWTLAQSRPIAEFRATASSATVVQGSVLFPTSQPRLRPI